MQLGNWSHAEKNGHAEKYGTSTTWAMDVLTNQGSSVGAACNCLPQQTGKSAAWMYAAAHKTVCLPCSEATARNPQLERCGPSWFLLVHANLCLHGLHTADCRRKERASSLWASPLVVSAKRPLRECN
jgi:hypothetical protein